MKKYELKKDLSHLTPVVFSFVIIVAIFIFFSLSFLLPVYLLSKNHPRIYSLSVSLLILSALLFFSAKWILKIWNKYKNIYFIVHIVFSPFFIIITLTLLGFEFAIFRLIELFRANGIDSTLMNNAAFFEKTVYIITACLNLANVPFLLIIIYLTLNAVFIKLFFEVLSFMPALAIIIIINIIIIILLFFLRRLFHFVKLKLRENQVKTL